MASAAGPFPIYYNPDVHNFYIKQKNEFHFNHKSDNEFLMFLLDTAVRVISIVQHLAPVIEAVSDAGAEVEDSFELSPANASLQTSVLPGPMEIDTMPISTPLSDELEQINQEITNAQQEESSKIAFPTISVQPPYQTASKPVVESVPSLTLTTPTLTPAMISVKPPLIQPAIIQPETSAVTAAINELTSLPIPTMSQHNTETILSDAVNKLPFPPNVPIVLIPTSAQPSQDVSTTMPSVRQPVAEASTESVKMEQPVPELVDIKEEVEQSEDEETSLSSGMNNYQNFVLVPTATPSSLPPSFLDRGSGNPLSMVGSISTSDDVSMSRKISELSDSIIKNITEASLNPNALTREDSSSNPPNTLYCPHCPFTAHKGVRSRRRWILKRHITEVHGLSKEHVCEICRKQFKRKENLMTHRYQHSVKSEKFSENGNGNTV